MNVASAFNPGEGGGTAVARAYCHRYHRLHPLPREGPDGDVRVGARGLACGWCWQKVTPLLRAAGHDVVTPTLTGLGERVHLLTPAVSLETHIQDVLGVLHYEDLQQVILVGHSYGGSIITGVADHAADRLAYLVYLDAFVPQDGQCLLDLLPPEGAAAVREQTETTGGRISAVRSPPRVPSPCSRNGRERMRAGGTGSWPPAMTR